MKRKPLPRKKPKSNRVKIVEPFMPETKAPITLWSYTTRVMTYEDMVVDGSVETEWEAFAVLPLDGVTTCRVFFRRSRQEAQPPAS